MRIRRALTGVGVVAALIAGLACAAPGGTSVHHTTTSTSTAPGARYKDAESLMAAMAANGAPCNPQDCTVAMFLTHASAQAYAHQAAGRNFGTPIAEVVGPNWVVNTDPAFARKVVQAVGGQLITGPAASASPSAAVTQPASPKPVVRVHFIVTGTGLPSIMYGSDSDNRSPPGRLGPLGDGNQLPWRASMKFDPSAQFYSLNAQLEGGGDISCKIVVTAGPSYTKITVSHGHASGGYNICSAQAAPTDSTGLNWQNEE